MVDCDDTDNGCNGGLPENAYKAIEDLGGLETEKAYPYEGRDDKCHLEKKKVIHLRMFCGWQERTNVFCKSLCL